MRSGSPGPGVLQERDRTLDCTPPPPTPGPAEPGLQGTAEDPCLLSDVSEGSPFGGSLAPQPGEQKHPPDGLVLAKMVHTRASLPEDSDSYLFHVAFDQHCIQMVGIKIKDADV